MSIPPASRPLTATLGLLVVAAAGVLLRTCQLGRDCFWYDEVVTMRLARTASPAELGALLGQIDGTRAPLHPLLLQAWVRVLGSSEWAGRSFSVACGLLTIGVVYRLGQGLLGEASGRWAAWLTAVCPPLVSYAREARMYAWLVLLTCLSWLVLAGFRQEASRWRQAAYGVLLAGIVYSHPLGLFMVAAHVVAYLALRGSIRLGFVSWMLILTGVALAVVPWLPRYLDHGTDYPVPRAPFRYLLAVPIEYVGGNSLVLLVCLAIIAAGFMRHREAGAQFGLTSPEILLLTWLIVPPTLMYVYSVVTRPIFGPPRYHLFVAPAYLILLGRGLSTLPRLLRWPLAAGGLALSLALIQANVYAKVARADWRGLREWIQGTTFPHAVQVVVVVHPSDPRFPRDQVEAARYYLEPATRVVPAPADNEKAEAGALVLDVHCLSASQARRPSPGEVTDGLSPRLYGLEVRRRDASR